MSTATPTADAPTTFEDVAELLRRLGDVPPDRVLLNPPPGLATEADLAEARRRTGRVCELVDGVLVEKAMGYSESSLAIFLAGFLNAFVRPRRLGLVTGSDGLMRLAPGLVRIPDVAFASWDRFPGRRPSPIRVADFPPDLAVEVLSPSNTAREIDLKILHFFQAGTRLFWVVDPGERTVRVHSEPGRSVTLAAADTLDGGDVLPGFALPLHKLFSILDDDGDD